MFFVPSPQDFFLNAARKVTQKLTISVTLPALRFIDVLSPKIKRFSVAGT
jgi:hypothetical protein